MWIHAPTYMFKQGPKEKLAMDPLWQIEYETLWVKIQSHDQGK